MELDLFTDELILRPAEISDAEWIAAYAGDWDVACSTAKIPHPYSLSMAVDFLTTMLDSDHQNSNRVMAILRFRPKREPVGLIGLHQLKAGRAELGYWIGKPFWNMGYASQAAVSIVDFAFAQLDLRQLEAHHYIDNPASGRVLEKAGFRYTGASVPILCVSRGQEVTSLNMIQLRNDWLKR